MDGATKKSHHRDEIKVEAARLEHRDSRNAHKCKQQEWKGFIGPREFEYAYIVRLYFH